MSRLPFIKMHGAGNDYVFVDGFATDVPANPAQFAVKVSNRNFGIGSDGLVLMQPSTNAAADVCMNMWNADGSKGSMCGNAARCLALWMELNNRTAGRCIIETTTRLVEATTIQIDRRHQQGDFCVNLGEPQFDAADCTTLELLPDLHVAGMDVSDLQFMSVSMGNPHAVFFVDRLSDRLVRQVGAAVEQHARFPGGTNVQWAKLTAQNELQVRVWERGSGETLACGSGACAAAVAAIAVGKCQRDREVLVNMPGGILKVKWRDTGTVQLSGPAVVSFVGETSG